MLRLPFRQFEILVDNDSAYLFDTSDSPRNYKRSYRLDDEPYRPSSLHSVRIVSTDDESEIASCILGAAGGATGIHEHWAVIQGDSLIIAVGPFLVALHLPTLELNWKTKTDQATCFGVYNSPANGCYISHGEMEIARVSYGGEIEWTQGGADIFTNGFTLSENCVTAVDWNQNVYVWDIKTGEPVTIR